MSGGGAQAGGSETPVSARPPAPLRGFGSASRERCEFYGGREMINFALLFKCRRGASPGFHSVAQLTFIVKKNQESEATHVPQLFFIFLL